MSDIDQDKKKAILLENLGIRFHRPYTYAMDASIYFTITSDEVKSRTALELGELIMQRIWVSIKPNN